MEEEEAGTMRADEDEQKSRINTSRQKTFHINAGLKCIFLKVSADKTGKTVSQERFYSP